MAGEPVTGTLAAGVTTTATAPVLIGGIDAAGIARTLLVNSNGSLVVPTDASLQATTKGFVAETYPFGGFAGGAAAVGGTAATSNVQGTLIALRQGQVISNLIIFCVAAGTLVTLSKMGLYKTDGTLLAATADGHASLAATSYHVLAVAKDGSGNTITSVTVPADGGYYIGRLDLASGGTAPTFLRAQSQTGGGAQVASKPRPYFNVSAQSDIAGNVTPADATSCWWFACS